MIPFLIRRFAAGFVTLLVIATICFTMTRAAPGSPFTTEKTLHPEIIRNFEEFYGLDQPIYVQYGRTMWGYLRGRMGPSMFYRDVSEVGEIIWPALITSVILGILAAILAFALGIPLGLVAAAHQNRPGDYAAMSLSVGGICIPNFLLGPLLVLLFTFALGWLPPARWPEEPEDWTRWSEVSKVILPAITLALVHVAYLSRLTRAGMLDVMNRDYIRTARAKGLSEWNVFIIHGLKNGVTPAISYAGPMVAAVVTGSIVVEKIFAIPGLGQHFVNSALNRDMNLIMACVLVYSVLVIGMNLLVDFIYGILDPRVRVA